MNTSAFDYRNGVLHADDVPLTEIAEQFGTPTFVYSQRYFEQRYAELSEALAGIDHQLCYAVKANSNLSVLHTFAQLGAGFDIVSGGELQRVITAGGDPSKVLFSGVGKTTAEIDFALKHQIGCFNVESEPELERIADRAALLHASAPISVRVNPNVDAATHPYISTGLKNNKFGVPSEQATALYRFAAAHPALKVVGIDCHIGSQIADPAPLLEAMNNLLQLVDSLAAEGITIEHLDLGGGLGVTYDDEPDFATARYGAALRTALADRKLKLLLEPGRFLVANGGVLLTRVEYLKPAAARTDSDPSGRTEERGSKTADEQAPDADGGKNFAVVDAAMNDLIRPALYQAHHGVLPVQPSAAESRRWDIVGPVCESGDFLALDRTLALTAGDLLAVQSAGAYGMVQSSNYNTRGRAAEVLVNGDTVRRVRHRETVRDQIALELDGLPASAFDVELKQASS